MKEKLNFACDYMHGAHPAILKRMLENNLIPSGVYGDDLLDLMDMLYDQADKDSFWIIEEPTLELIGDALSRLSFSKSFRTNLVNTINCIPKCEVFPKLGNPEMLAFNITSENRSVSTQNYLFALVEDGRDEIPHMI